MEGAGPLNVPKVRGYLKRKREFWWGQVPLFLFLKKYRN